MHDQAVAATVDERQLEQALDGLAAIALAGHGGEQRGRDPPHDRRSFERAPRERIVHVVEIEPRELLDDPGHHCVLDLELRSFGDAGGGEHQRERMPAGDAVQARGVAGADPVVLEQLERGGVLERSERERAERLEREPGADGPLAAGEQQADARRQHWHEHLP